MVACAGVISACEDAMGCSLNGDCVDRRCQCEPQWEGERCEVLRFVKPMDWESGYHVDGNASWGGNAIYEDGEYHLFMAQMLNGCGLDDYGSNSAIARASSKNVSGPYTFQEFVVLPFAHNPTIRKLPNGEGYIIYFIGGYTATPQICNNGTTPLRVAASTHHTTSHLPGDIRTAISTAVSPSLKGPWSISPLYFEGKSVNASTDLRAGFTNPSPHFHPDGSVTLAFQASPLGRHYELIGVARAASWNSTYALITGDSVIKNDPALCVAGMGEDPFIWEDRRGFHILIHGMCPRWFHQRRLRLFQRTAVPHGVSPSYPLTRTRSLLLRGIISFGGWNARSSRSKSTTPLQVLRWTHLPYSPGFAIRKTVWTILRREG